MIITDQQPLIMNYEQPPPSYEATTEGNSLLSSSMTHSSDNKSPMPAMAPPSQYTSATGPHSPSQPSPPQLYHYINPHTQEQISSSLPPTHPTIICLQSGMHITETKFGLLGILAAIFWFPLGIGLCLLDRKVKCSRCGEIIDEGLCGRSFD